MITPIFLGKAKNGTLNLQTPDSFRKYLLTLNGKEVQVIVRKTQKIRSNPQNRFYWGVVVKLISETTGYTDEEAHDALRMMFLKEDDAKLPTLRSTTELTTVEFEEYIEKIRVWAAQELNCAVPLPNEVDL